MGKTDFGLIRKGKKSVVLLGGKRPWYWYGSNRKALESLIDNIIDP